MLPRCSGASHDTIVSLSAPQSLIWSNYNPAASSSRSQCHQLMDNPSSPKGMRWKSTKTAVSSHAERPYGGIGCYSSGSRGGCNRGKSAKRAPGEKPRKRRAPRTRGPARAAESQVGAQPLQAASPGASPPRRSTRTELPRC